MKELSAPLTIIFSVCGQVKDLPLSDKQDKNKVQKDLEKIRRAPVFTVKITTGSHL